MASRSWSKFALIAASTLVLAVCRSSVEIPREVHPLSGVESVKPVRQIEFRRDAELEEQFAKIAEEAKGKVGAAAILLETGEAAFLNAAEHYPMHSVYKLPISMAVMEQVRRGKLTLDQKIAVTPDDFVRQGMASVLRDKNPKGGEFTIRELIRLAIVESDGTASDVLMRVAGGAGGIQAFLTQIGITDMKVVNTEKEIGRDWETQYQNWATPTAAVSVLQQLCYNASAKASGKLDCPALGLIDDSPFFHDNTRAFLREMAVSIPGAKRLKGLLPKNTVVAHKTGTGGTRDGITSATNDIGIIYLPNRQTLAIAVFVSDSSADEKTREAVIAKIAKAAWDKWAK